MARLVFYMFISALIMYTFTVSTYADGAPASQGQNDTTIITNNGKKPVEETDVEDEESEFVDVELETVFIQDPVQPYNRAIFTFNDKAYYYFFRPIYKGYEVVLPEKARLGVRNFFTNVRTPVRLFNCLFQGKFKGAGTEALRLVINSTLGVAGFSDPAKKYFELDIQDEDFGQTLGRYKMGTGPHIEWPFLGPSNVRDTIGLVGDIALDPITLLFLVNPFAPTGAKAFMGVNDLSIDKGDTYESLVEKAIDPYIAVQDAYTQNRSKKIRE